MLFPMLSLRACCDFHKEGKWAAVFVFTINQHISCAFKSGPDSQGSLPCPSGSAPHGVELQ